MTKIAARIETISTLAAALSDAFDAIQQPRSTFQIERFVVGQHATPERQYHQCVLEMSIKHDNIRRAMLARRRLEIRLVAARAAMEKSRGTERELIELDLAELGWDLENTDRAILGAAREFEALYRIYERLPKFTAEQLQAAEPEYWRERLERQAAQDIAAQGSIGVGNLDALRQIAHPLGLAGSRLPAPAGPGGAQERDAIKAILGDPRP